MVRRLVTSTLVLALAGIGAASPPLDPTGELTGFVPPDRQVLKCERYVNKRVALALGCVMKCHDKAVSQGFRSIPFDEEACEDTCRTKYEASLQLIPPGNCHPCLTTPIQVSLYPSYEQIAEQVTGFYYCAPGTPIGPDDTGEIPTQVAQLKCEQKIARNTIKLTKCLKLDCHRNLVDDVFDQHPFDEKACSETDPVSSCQARFHAANDLTVGCPACISTLVSRQAIFDYVHLNLDAIAGLVYCASPSGAFVD